MRGSKRTRKNKARPGEGEKELLGAPASLLASGRRRKMTLSRGTLAGGQKRSSRSIPNRGRKREQVGGRRGCCCVHKVGEGPLLETGENWTRFGSAGRQAHSNEVAPRLCVLSSRPMFNWHDRDTRSTTRERRGKGEKYRQGRSDWLTTGGLSEGRRGVPVKKERPI